MKPLRILIVDDDADFADTLADVFEARGHRTEIARSGEEAIGKYESSDYDLSFMDVRLPGISGVESFQAIRQISPGARVVIMTGYSVDHLLRQAIDAGAWAIMQKPLEMNSILRMAETIQPRGLALIADDDPDFAQTLRALLSRRGYAALLARGGAEALKIASENELDFLILDVRLPEANGLEVCRTLRERGIDCPIILVTGYAQEECDSIQAMKRHDAIGPLAKPFDEDGLMRAIAEACGRRR